MEKRIFISFIYTLVLAVVFTIIFVYIFPYSGYSYIKIFIGNVAVWGMAVVFMNIYMYFRDQQMEIMQKSEVVKLPNYPVRGLLIGVVVSFIELMILGYDVLVNSYFIFILFIPVFNCLYGVFMGGLWKTRVGNIINILLLIVYMFLFAGILIISRP